MNRITNLKLIAWSINGSKGVEAPDAIKGVCDQIQSRLTRIESTATNGGIIATFDIGGRIFLESQRVDEEATNRAEALAYGIENSKVWATLIGRLAKWIEAHPDNLEWLGCDWQAD